MSRHWVSVSAINDDWDVEIDAIGDLSEERSWRHRAWRDNDIYAEWEPGRPPTGRYAKPVEPNFRSE